MMIGVGATFTIEAPLSLWIAAFGWLLLMLAILDLEYFWLPDRIVFSVLVLGLVAAILNAPETIVDRLIGSVAGFLALEGIRRAYRAMRRRDGMGAGDPKLLAAIAIWTGWQSLPFVLLGASICGLAWAATSALAGRKVDAKTVLPLGTLMAGAGYVAVVMFPPFSAS